MEVGGYSTGKPQSHPSGELEFGDGTFRVPAARGFAADGRDVLDRNLPSSGLGSLDLDLRRNAGLLIDLLVRSGFVLDVKLWRYIRLEIEDAGLGRDAVIDLVEDRAAEGEAF